MQIYYLISRIWDGISKISCFSPQTISLIQFSIVCILEIVLRVLSRFEFGETAGPMIMFIIPVFFYVVLWFFNISFEEVICPSYCVHTVQARDSNWLFPLAPSTHGWDMWNEFLNSEIHWGVVLLQLPTILSLTAFTLLLVPIRIPTLSMITGLFHHLIIIYIVRG